MSRLIVAAIPLGNPGDASQRLIAAIGAAKFVAAEDSRRFARLCKDLGVACEANVISFFEGNERERLDELTRALAQHGEVLLVTDAGTPGISDPGYRAIQRALEVGAEIQVLPGPSAATTALLLSGLPSDRFTFEGFPARSDLARERQFEMLADEPRTMIFFEAPHRITAFLDSAVQTFGAKRIAAICREMTKTYEEVVRGTLGELHDWSKQKEMLGEFTVVIAGFDPSLATHSDSEIVELVTRYEGGGVTRKEAIAMVAKELALPKRKVFDIMVAAK